MIVYTSSGVQCFKQHGMHGGECWPCYCLATTATGHGMESKIHTIVTKVDNAPPQQYDDLFKQLECEWGGRMNGGTDCDAVLGSCQRFHIFHDLHMAMPC